MLLNRLARTYAPGCQAPPGEASGGGEIWVSAFPLPENLADVQAEALRLLGFSRQKARYLVDLAGALSSGLLDLKALAELDDEEALTRLRQLRGVGRWSAEYALLRGLGRLHV